MKRLLIPLLVLLTLPSVVYGSHLNNQRELIVTSESTRESIELAKYLKDNGVVKYSAYWCPNCLNQSELFGKQAYRELNVDEYAVNKKVLSDDIKMMHEFIEFKYFKKVMKRNNNIIE